MSTRKAESDPPIVEGELVPGSNMRRRFQGAREICPRYVGPERSDSDRQDAARAECVRLGIRVYIDDRDIYMRIAGEWYLAFVGQTFQVHENLRR